MIGHVGGAHGSFDLDPCHNVYHAESGMMALLGYQAWGEEGACRLEYGVWFGIDGRSTL